MSVGRVAAVVFVAVGVWLLAAGVGAWFEQAFTVSIGGTR